MLNDNSPVHDFHLNFGTFDEAQALQKICWDGNGESVIQALNIHFHVRFLSKHIFSGDSRPTSEIKFLAPRIKIPGQFQRPEFPREKRFLGGLVSDFPFQNFLQEPGKPKPFFRCLAPGPGQHFRIQREANRFHGGNIMDSQPLFNSIPPTQPPRAAENAA